MPKNSGYLARVAAQQKARDEFMRDRMRTFVLDAVTIALGKFGLTQEQILQFRDIYMETESEFIDEIRDDCYGNNDEHITYAKDRIDRALREVVPEEMFRPYEQRYIKGAWR